jgi:hypothetical protein
MLQIITLGTASAMTIATMSTKASVMDMAMRGSQTSSIPRSASGS